MILGNIDLPKKGSVVSTGRISVAGWAFSVSSPVSRVEISLDDHVLGLAALARPRPDVAAALKNDAAELSGFESRIDLHSLGWLSDEVEVRVTVVLLNGKRTNLPPVKILVKSPARLQPGERRIRLLCFARSLDHGGSQLRMRELVEYLGSSGEFEATVLTPNDGPLRRDLEAAGAAVRVEPIPFGQHSAYERQLTKLVAWAAGRFDVTFGFTLTSFPAVDLGERLGLPSLWRIGECETVATVVEWLGGHLDPEVEYRADRAFAAAAAVLFNSNSALQYFRNRGHSGCFTVLGSGTDVTGAVSYQRTNDKDACRRSLGIAPDRRVLLYVGTLWPVKGQALLISSLWHLHAEYPQLECILVGQQSRPYVERLFRLIDRLKLHQYVRVLPFSDDLRAWRCAADAAVCTSESESMSASILEAMAFGLPVLSSRVGSSTEVVEEGVTGWLCEPNDLGSLIDGLRRVAAAEPRELRLLGEQAMCRVRRSHDRAVALSRTADLIRNVSRGLRLPWLEGWNDARRERHGSQPDAAHGALSSTLEHPCG